MATNDTTEIEWRSVASSNIARVGRLGRALYIEFQDGSTYVYAGAAMDFDALVSAKSPGGWFYRHIKGLVPAERIS